MEPRLRERLPGILQTIASFVQVYVIGTTVRQQQQEPVPGRFPREEPRGMAQRRAQPGIAIGLQGGDAPPDLLTRRLLEPLEPQEINSPRSLAPECKYRMPVAQSGKGLDHD